MDPSPRYIHALGSAHLTRFYDPLIRVVMRESAFKNRLIDIASIQPGDRVLDVASGTGTLVLLLKQRQPVSTIVGVDGDPEVVDIARQKAASEHADVRFVEGFAQRLPFDDQSFNVVVSSIAIHHLATEDKHGAFSEMLRVLKPGGRLVIVDFGPPKTMIGLALGRVLRFFEEVADNLDGRLPGMLTEAGFADVAEVDRMQTALGPLVFLRGLRPVQGPPTP